MSDLRTAAQQALAFTMRDFASLRDFEAAKAVLHDNLRAALAQQDEPCPNCASLEAQNTELDRRLAELERAESAQESVDVGLLEYRGNSVAFIHQKMTAYRTGIDAAWDAFRAKGLHPDGKTSLADMIAKYTAPPQRLPQTIDEAMQQPRAMAQAYENGYKAGEAHEREACAKACEHQPHWVACAAAIRARGNT